MSGRGRRAALPAGGHSRPEYLAGDEKGALAVRHYNRAGRVREYDFTALPVPAAMQASLAALFAARCTPDRWSVHATSRRTWIYLRQFAGFLDGLRQQPRDLDELTPELIRLWRESLSEAGGAAAFKTVSGLLRGDARLREGHAADELARRYRAPRSTVQSYSESEFGRITASARRQFRAALGRIGENAAHLQRWREGGFAEGSADWIIGEGLDILARTGGLPKYAEKSGERTVVAGKYRRASGGTNAAATWQRLFLSRMEAVALGVLLVAEYGWNLSVIDRAEVPRASPDQGEDGHPTYRIPLEKPRRGAGRHYETRNVTDDGAASRGRLITQALEATRFARALVEEAAPGTSRLIVWRTGLRGRSWASTTTCQPQPPPAGRTRPSRSPSRPSGRCSPGRCVPGPDGQPGRHLIRGREYKTATDEYGNHQSGGAEREAPWVAITPVVNAIRVLERMVPEGCLLFDHHAHDLPFSRAGTGSLNVSALRDRMEDFAAWANREAARHGLAGEVIPADPHGSINLMRFRRILSA